MKNNVVSNRISVFVIILVTLISSIFSACDQNGSDPSDDHFRTMEVKNKVAHFSFEYRTYYHDIDGPWVDDNEYRKITYVDILASKKTIPAPNPQPGEAGETVNMSYTPAVIGVNVGNALNVPFRPFQERISSHLTSWSRWEHFKLLERKNVMISGIQGEMAAYEVDGLIGPKLLYQSDVAFDYNGQEWDINLKADVSLTDNVKEDLQHVIDTFKILQ
jgi:hypothetical protein